MTKYQKIVLVTGVAGFIGSHFVNVNLERYKDWLFIGIDKLNYASDVKRLPEGKNFRFINMDLCDEKLEDLFKEYNFTDVINFAAESSVDRSFEAPIAFSKNNILGGHNLLECIRKFPAKLIHISTDEVYGETANATEDSTLTPTNPYSASKAALDMLIHSYKCSYNLYAIIVRSNNIYGSGQNPEKLIPRTIKCLNNGLPVPLHGDGLNKRCYLHVKDFLSALDLVWLNNHHHDIINIGHNHEIDNLSLVTMISKLYGVPPKIKFVADRNYNDKSYSLDCLKITKLGWKPKVQLEQGLKELVQEMV